MGRGRKGALNNSSSCLGCLSRRWSHPGPGHDLAGGVHSSLGELFRVHMALVGGNPVGHYPLCAGCSPSADPCPLPLLCALKSRPYDHPLPNGFRWDLANRRHWQAAAGSDSVFSQWPRGPAIPPGSCLPFQVKVNAPTCCWPQCTSPSHAGSLLLYKLSLYSPPEDPVGLQRLVLLGPHHPP